MDQQQKVEASQAAANESQEQAFELLQNSDIFESIPDVDE